MTYLPADGDHVTVTRTDCDGHVSTWSGVLADQRPTGFTLIDARGRRTGFVGAITEPVLASGMTQSVRPVHNEGDPVVFDDGAGRPLAGRVVRVWAKPNAPYVTVLSDEPRPRRFVRLAERVQLDHVAACLAVHAAASVAHCAGCGICEDCDATLGAQETPDHELCETCANRADEERGLRLLATAYTTDPTA